MQSAFIPHVSQAMVLLAYLMLELCDAPRHAPNASIYPQQHVPRYRTLHQLPMVWYKGELSRCAGEMAAMWTLATSVSGQSFQVVGF